MFLGHSIALAKLKVTPAMRLAFTLLAYFWQRANALPAHLCILWAILAGLLRGQQSTLPFKSSVFIGISGCVIENGMSCLQILVSPSLDLSI